MIKNSKYDLQHCTYWRWHRKATKLCLGKEFENEHLKSKGSGTIIPWLAIDGQASKSATISCREHWQYSRGIEDVVLQKYLEITEQ